MSRKTIIILIVILAVFAAVAYSFFMQKATIPVGGQPPLPVQTITVGTTSITAEIASTDAERTFGLSNRASLPAGHGMLFVFDRDGNWGIWMPDMKFSIDIIWADSAGKIIALDANISPATYPTVFYPNNYARY